MTQAPSRNERPAGAEADPDLRPVSVQLGAVVPPEDPEDWRQPLTWAAAAGMLGAAAVAAGWYLLAPPADASSPAPGSWAVAITLVAGAAAAGATQRGALRAGLGTVAAGLFAALGAVIVGYVAAAPAAAAAAPPSVTHAALSSGAGLAGSLLAAVVAAMVANSRGWMRRMAPAALVGAGLAIALLPRLYPA